MMLVHGLMLALFVGWGVYFVVVLVRFRQKRHPRAVSTGARGRVAGFVEIGVVIAEAVLLVGFALPIWFRQTGTPPDGNPLVVRVVAEQFTWNVHYPGADGQFGETSLGLISPTNPLGLDRKSRFGGDDILLPGLLHVPVNRPVLIQLSSKDVIHSFGVPAMRVKQDAIPGLLSPVWFTPTATGEFDIACSQLCGMAHYRMKATLVVQSEAEFEEFQRQEALLIRR
jgi:cytochrome c oxidase subunit 2